MSGISRLQCDHQSGVRPRLLAKRPRLSDLQVKVKVEIKKTLSRILFPPIMRILRRLGRIRYGNPKIHEKRNMKDKSHLTQLYEQARTPTLCSSQWPTFELKLGGRQKSKGEAFLPMGWALLVMPTGQNSRTITIIHQNQLHVIRAVEHVKSQGVRLVLEKEIAHKVNSNNCAKVP